MAACAPQLIGSGSFGLVLATNAGAVKQIHANSYEWLLELIISRYLDHPNVIRLGKPRVMVCRVNPEKGRSEYRMCVRLPMQRFTCDAFDIKLGPACQLTVARDVLTALTYCHSRGVMHRDIKPSNVLLDVVDGKVHRAVLADFGLATWRPAPRLLSPEVVTIYYRPPELVKDSCFVLYDGRIDIWSYGMTLVHIALVASAKKHTLIDMFSSDLEFEEAVASVDPILQIVSQELDQHPLRPVIDACLVPYDTRPTADALQASDVLKTADASLDEQEPAADELKTADTALDEPADAGAEELVDFFGSAEAVEFLELAPTIDSMGFCYHTVRLAYAMLKRAKFKRVTPHKQTAALYVASVVLHDIPPDIEYYSTKLRVPLRVMASDEIVSLIIQLVELNPIELAIGLGLNVNLLHESHDCVYSE
jgi:serine/threonine protein kinase